jgi:hypothetical protein
VYARIQGLLALTLLLVVTAANGSAQGQALPTAGIPDVHSVLAKARGYVDELPANMHQAHYLQRIAALQARADDVQSAFLTLRAIRLDQKVVYQTAANLQRVGFFETVEQVAGSGDVERAITIVDSAPSAYATYRDTALGRIAVAGAGQGDSLGAKEALRRIKDSQLADNFALDVAVELRDKRWAKRLLLNDRELLQYLRDEFNPNGAASEEWSGVLYYIALLMWCRETELSNAIKDSIVARSSDPAGVRATFRRYLRLPASERNAAPATAVDSDPRHKPSVDEIRRQLEQALSRSNRDGKIEQLLNVAEQILENDNAALP